MKWLAAILLLVGVSQAQMFTVLNEKNIKFDQQEADRMYMQAVDCVRQEYHLTEPVTPTFILILGSNDKNFIHFPAYDKDWGGGTVNMQKWEPQMFRAVVIAFSINELLRPQNIIKLAQRLNSIDAATTSVDDLKRQK
jgi:hypothetical protein